MIKLSPKLEVVLNLWDRNLPFTGLLNLTGLSNAWLSRTLKSLIKEGVVNYDPIERTYRLMKTAEIENAVRPYWSVHLIEKAKRLAAELEGDGNILAAVLFGSTAQGKAGPDSDLDLLIITREAGVEEERRVWSELFKLEVKFFVATEAVILGFDDFKSNVKAESGIIFGVANGYIVLFDKSENKIVSTLLKDRMNEIYGEYRYVEEAYVWVKK